jgi:hypothetical protein
MPEHQDFERGVVPFVDEALDQTLIHAHGPWARDGISILA